MENHTQKISTNACRNESGNNEILVDYRPVFRVFTNGRIERLDAVAPIPPSLDPQTGVESKDAVISLDTGVTARLFKPSNTINFRRDGKLPLLVYFHGGGFCSGSTFSPMHHNYLNNLACQAKMIIVSIEYRKAPEHPLPTAYNDCWEALNWVASHKLCGGIIKKPMTQTRDMHAPKEPWLNQALVDYDRVIIAGESSGANIAHNIALRVGMLKDTQSASLKIDGLILVHPFFYGKDSICDEASLYLNGQPAKKVAENIWVTACFGSNRLSYDDPELNPAKDANLSKLGCNRVLVCVAEKDYLRHRGVYYKQSLEKSGWKGKVELVESKGQGHTFHLYKPSNPKSLDLMKKVVAFLNPMSSRL